MITDKIKRAVSDALRTLGVSNPFVELEHPADFSHGDYSTNAALVYAKAVGVSPRQLAEQIATAIQGSTLVLEKGRTFIDKIEVAGPGFINFYLGKNVFVDGLKDILSAGEAFGTNKNLKGKKILVEYTDPNPFKEFHIGHLMSNTIGESIARLYEYSGAEVKRACYHGDVGLHVANAIWGMLEQRSEFEAVKNLSLSEKVAFLGRCYALGAKQTEEKIRADIRTINNKVFRADDKQISDLYDIGCEWSYQYFESIYKQLGTHFDFFFYEKDTGQIGKGAVEESLSKGVFEKSEGAVVYRGEKQGLHTRVFINKDGLPTYEAKELGLAKLKYDRYSYDQSLVITGNEVNDYFKVLLVAMTEVFPKLAEKTRHLSHGMMRLPSGKMSSRTGSVVTAESLLAAVEAMVHDKLDDRELMDMEKNKIAASVAIGAVKYSILRQAIGGDIIYDFEKSISFEGDSGPYLMYSYARACSVLRKAGTPRTKEYSSAVDSVGSFERLIIRFPEIVARAQAEHAPHHLANYLIVIAAAFNHFYAHFKILDAGKDSDYRILLTGAFAQAMKNGLYLLGIKAIDRM